jgi:hypothetical protein
MKKAVLLAGEVRIEVMGVEPCGIEDMVELSPVVPALGKDVDRGTEQARAGRINRGWSLR